jgi:hypothetical protein
MMLAFIAELLLIIMEVVDLAQSHPTGQHFAIIIRRMVEPNNE